jgi:membrane protease YdiL (CAAX protease family)
MSLLDHLLVVTIVVVHPTLILLRFRRVLRELEADPDRVRPREYRRAMLWQWGLVALALSRWLSAGRPLQGLGLTLPASPAAALSLLAPAALVIVFWAQHRAVTRKPRLKQALRAGLERVEWLLPHSRREHRLFLALSLTAGFCEELLYRGVLIAWLATSLDPLATGLASGLLFGLAHAYQGRIGMLQTAGVGLVCAALAMLSGSLLAPVLVHAAIDVQAGRMARLAGLGEPPAERSPAPESSPNVTSAPDPDPPLGG